MKTLTLGEAYAKANPLPVEYLNATAKGGSIDAALLAHAYNVLPEVVATLTEFKVWLMEPDLSPETLAIMDARVEKALAKASRVSIP